jgi:ATP-dependent protease ClpP protease subunit
VGYNSKDRINNSKTITKREVEKMKHLSIFIISFLLAISGVAYGYNGDAEAVEEKEKAQPQIACPVTKIVDNDLCMGCHQLKMENGKPKFGLKEIPLKANYSSKPHFVKIIQESVGGPPVVYLTITKIGDGKLRDVADYLKWHPEIKKVIIEFHTGGGDVFDAWRSVGIIKEMQSHGVHIQTTVLGMAASAGVIMLVAGDTRLVNPNSQIMIHKIWTFTMFSIKTADSSQDQADVLKHFQDNINQFFRDRTNLTEEQLDNKIFKKDWWMTGAEAIELGIATGSI